MMEYVDDSESRQYFRIEVKLPVEFRRISMEEYLKLENEILCNSTGIADRLNEIHFLKETAFKDDKEKGQLLTYIKLIDKKLDLILELLNNTKNESLYSNRYIDSNISGSGISFTTDVELKENEYVELKIILPIYPYAKINTLCTVVRSSHCNTNGVSNWETALVFKAINEDDRETLINFIFEKEREIIRMKKEKTG